MFKIYEYIYPTVDQQIEFSPSNALTTVTTTTATQFVQTRTITDAHLTPGATYQLSNYAFPKVLKSVSAVIVNGNAMMQNNTTVFGYTVDLITGKLTFVIPLLELDTISVTYTCDVTTITHQYNNSSDPLSTTLTLFKNGDKDNQLDFTTIVTSDGTTQVTKLKLEQPLSINDYIVMYIGAVANFIVGDYTNTLYKRYGSDQRLMYNQEYFGNIDIGDIPVKFNFTSRYDPFYTTTKAVRDDVSHIVSISDRAIDYIIYDNSMKVLYELSGGADSNIAIVVPFLLSVATTIPYNIQQYVRYMAEYDIIYAAYALMAGKSGRINKRLADMQIEKEVRLPDLNAFLKGAKDKINQYPLIDSSQKMVRSVVKGSIKEPWPVTSPRRSF